ncbi:MAG: hypothetical protein L0Y66_27150 [Myxococcaceae bacterium]|nr:hypothetical protein [Myxococcaceae bacterium]MCI0669875.1 hypothetical protein [Myxococcaceae bacterium]
MPRSFRFEHFTVPPRHPPPNPEVEDKGAYARTHKVSAPEATLHYGKAHAQTEELLRKKREEHRHEGYEAPARGGSPTKGGRGGQGAQKLSAKAGRGAPIGALPATEEAPRPEGYGALWEDAQRNLRVLQQAFSDFSDAVGRLARIPVDAVRLSRRRHRHA